MPFETTDTQARPVERGVPQELQRQADPTSVTFNKDLQDAQARNQSTAQDALPALTLDDTSPAASGKSSATDQQISQETDEKGITTTKYADGRIQYYDKNEDMTVTVNPDGTTVVREPEKYISGRVIEPKRYQETTSYPNGTEVTVLADGTRYTEVPGKGQQIERPNGRVEQRGHGRTRIYAPGTIEESERIKP